MFKPKGPESAPERPDNDNIINKPVSRRNFLKMTGAALAVAAFPGLAEAGGRAQAEKSDNEKLREAVNSFINQINRENPTREDGAEQDLGECDEYVSSRMVYERAKEISPLIYHELREMLGKETDFFNFFKDHGYLFNEARHLAGGDVFIRIERIENLRLNQVKPLDRFFPGHLLEQAKEVIFVSHEKMLSQGQGNGHKAIINTKAIESGYGKLKKFIPENETWSGLTAKNFYEGTLANEMVEYVMANYELRLKEHYDTTGGKFGTVHFDGRWQATEFISDVMSLNVDKTEAHGLIFNSLSAFKYHGYSAATSLMDKLLTHILEKKGLKTSKAIGSGALPTEEKKNIFKSISNQDLELIQKEYTKIGKELLADAVLLANKQ